MASYSITYNKIGKGFNKSNGTVDNVFGNDFNFNEDWDLSNDKYADYIYNQTTSYNLAGFQIGNEVFGYALRVYRDGPGSAYTQKFNMEFKRSNNGVNWEVGWRWNDITLDWSSLGDGSYSWRWKAFYVGIDNDEIRPGYTYYKFYSYAQDGTWDVESPTATISNLSFDSTLHRPGYLRVEGSYLCYTDCIGWEVGDYNYGYKHKIKYDSNFSEYVGTDYSGKIWLETDVVRRIYYVDQYGYKRRTYEAQNRSGYPSGQGRYVGTSYKGRIWCPGNGDDYEDGYGHLCFVNQNGYLMRILNGNPNE